MTDDDLVDTLVAWATGTEMAPLPPDMVPGTVEQERRALAALGGLASSLIPRPNLSWPQALLSWMELGPRPPTSIMDGVRDHLDGQRDVLADAYERIVAGANRRRLGTFFTPAPIVDFMLEVADEVHGAPTTVIDPGAGVGAFSAAATRRWIGAQVVAVDVNVVTLGLLAARCSAQNLRIPALVLDDYLEWIGGYGGEERRLLIGNPPYTRHQEMTAKQKRVARDAAGPFVDSGLAGLSAYFLAASFASLKASDSLCFVLPGSWTEANYGRAMRRALWQHTGRRVELHGFPPTTEVFPGTKVTAMVVTVGPDIGGSQPFNTHQARLEKADVRVTRSSSRRRDGDEPRVFGAWLWPPPGQRRKSGTVSLGELATIRRGVATGANHFFMLTDADIEDLPPAAVRPAIRRLRHVPGEVLDQATHDGIGAEGHPRWLLSLQDDGLQYDGEVLRLLLQGRREGVHLGYLTSSRDPWWRVENLDPPSVFLSLGSKGRIRVVRNMVGAVHINSMHGAYIDEELVDEAALCWWLSTPDGQKALRSSGRHYSGGLIKLEPGDLRRVRVPSPDTLQQLYLSRG